MFSFALAEVDAFVESGALMLWQGLVPMRDSSFCVHG